MREGWREATIAEACDVVNGGTPKTGVAAYWGGNHMWITPAEMGKRSTPYVGETERRLTNAGLTATNLLPPHSVILSSRAPIGHLVINTVPMATNQGCKGLVPKPGVDHKYLYYYLGSIVGLLNDLGTGATFKELSGGKLKEVPIPLPSLLEQQRIVAILDEAFAGLAAATANAEKNLKNAQELFESYLNSIFAGEDEGRTEVSLGEVCAISSKLVDPREKKFIDLPHLGAGNMASRTGELSDIKTAREEGLKSGKFLFDSRMVLYSKIRPYLMKACRPDFEGLCSADVYPLVPDPSRLDRNFLFHLLMSKDFTDFAIAGSDRAGMPKVNRDHLFKYRVKLPGIQEQTRFSSKLDAISAETNRLQAFYDQRLTDIANLKRCILQKAFSGELTAPPTQAIKEAAE